MQFHSQTVTDTAIIDPSTRAMQSVVSANQRRNLVLFLAQIFGSQAGITNKRSASLRSLSAALSFLIRWTKHNKMVVHCQWGVCTGDKRYPEKIMGGKNTPIPSVKSRKEDTMAWINACRRPHIQLNLDRLNKNKGVCAGVSVPPTDFGCRTETALPTPHILLINQAR